MKRDNLLLLGAIAFGLYYLLKRDKTTNQDAPVVSESDNDMDDVMSGDSPSTLDGKNISFTKDDLRTKNRSIKLTSKKLGMTLVYNQPYRGGARPPQDIENRSNAWSLSGKPNGLKVRTFQAKLLPVGGGNPPEYSIAQTNDVIDFVFQNPENWSAEFGKARIVSKDKDLIPMNRPFFPSRPARPTLKS